MPAWWRGRRLAVGVRPEAGRLPGRQGQVEATINEARQTYETLQAQKVRAAMARKALGDTVIRAPYAGLIAEKHVNVGDYQEGDRIATLVRVDPLRVELSVPGVGGSGGEEGPEGGLHRPGVPGTALRGPDRLRRPRATRRHARAGSGGPGPQHQRRAPAWPFRDGQDRVARRPARVVPASAVRTEAGVEALCGREGPRRAALCAAWARSQGFRRGPAGREARRARAIDGFERLEDGIPVTAIGQTSDGSGSSAGCAGARRRGGPRAAARRGVLSIMQWLAEISVRRPVFASVLILFLVVVGIFAYFKLGVDRFPRWSSRSSP